MSNVLSVKVTSRKVEGQDVWEATATLDGAKPTKLTRKADGSTQYSSRSAAQGAAKRFAERYGYTGGVDFGTPVEAKPAVVKKAAKRSANTTATEPTV